MEPSINATSIETGLWQIENYLIEKYGTRQASADMAPLRWYVSTGRASVPFLRLLITAKPFMVARKLHEGGSYQEAVDRVKKFLKWEENL